MELSVVCTPLRDERNIDHDDDDDGERDNQQGEQCSDGAKRRKQSSVTGMSPSPNTNKDELSEWEHEPC